MNTVAFSIVLDILGVGRILLMYQQGADLVHSLQSETLTVQILLSRLDDIGFMSLFR